MSTYADARDSASAALPGIAGQRPGQVRARRREAGFGFLMIGLAVVFVGVFTFVPIVASFVLSFFKWDVISSPEWVGLANYKKLFTDEPVLASFGVTLLLAVGIVILQIGLGLLLAVLADNRRHGWTKAFFRTTFYLPLLASSAAVSIFMGYIFDAKFGLINYYLNQLGVPSVPWLINPHWAQFTVIMVVVWQQVGFTFVLFSAALTSVPRDILEATQIDGATAWSTLFRIKVPLISPTILFAMVMAVINAMQLFDQPFIMTKGGPGTSTTTATMSMYQAGFQNLQFGFASAIAILLLVIIGIVTAVQFVASRKLVFYQ